MNMLISEFGLGFPVVWRSKLFFLLLALGMMAVVASASLPGLVSIAKAQEDGIPINGYPVWQERLMLVTINACRMDPTGYRDTYLDYPDILNPPIYGPLPPLRWCEELNHAARFHSADMASCNSLQYDSCDGTTWFDRIGSYYSPYQNISEVNAAGYFNPQLAVKAWLEDQGLPDGSGGDGHRQILMSSNFIEAGAGFTYDPGSTFDRWYTVDLGRRNEVPTPAFLVEGVHLFINDGFTTFWANFYTSSSTSPQAVAVFVEGNSHEMTQHLGETSGSGSWSIDLPAGDDCRSYVFQFIDHAGQAHWYPQAGALRTMGEGSCAEDYIDGGSGFPSVPAATERMVVLEPAAPNPFNPSTLIRFRLEKSAAVRLFIVDARGLHVRNLVVNRLEAGPHAVNWNGRDDAGRGVASGVYRCVLQADAEVVSQPLTLLR
jgi:hypothetical protein